jgi:hypothetical protein
MRLEMNTAGVHHPGGISHRTKVVSKSSRLERQTAYARGV